MNIKTIILILTTTMMINSCNGQTKEKTRVDEQCPPVVRPATQANRFYTGNARELAEEVDSLLALHGSDAKYQNVAALIVPHAGYYFSGNVAASAYMAIDAKKQYKRIFLLGPSHHEWLNGASVNTEADWYATPLGNVKVDRETAVALTTTDSVFRYRPEAHDREHCLEVQLPFLQRFFTFHSSLFTQEVPPIVPIVISTNDYEKLKRMAEVLKPYFTDENLFIISSDFSHYPKYEDACEVDAKTGKAIETGDVEAFIATINVNARSGKRNLATSACGEFAIITLMLMLDDQYEVKHLMYQNSGDIDDHDHSRVVGYHSFAILRKDSTSFTLSDADKKALKEIAFNSIRDSLDGSRCSDYSSLFTLHSTRSVVPSSRCTSTGGCVAASDTLVRTIRCMKSWQRWRGQQRLKTRVSCLSPAKNWTTSTLRFPCSRPCAAFRVSTSLNCIDMASISRRAIAAARSCRRWPTR